MDLVARVAARLSILSLAAALFCFAAIVSTSCQAAAQVVVDARVQRSLPARQSAIEKGLELERSQLWSDAIRHYEAESRKYPDSTTLYQRLIISRLHYRRESTVPRRELHGARSSS